MSGCDRLVALDDGDVLAFICAIEQSSSPWPPSYWVDFDMHAARSTDAYRELYAVAATGWVEQGRIDHYAIAPPLDDVVAAWFGLGFGLEQVHGIRALADVAPRREHDRASIRRATPEDLPLLEHLLDVIDRHQRRSPVFGVNVLTPDELHDGHRDLLARLDCYYWLALVDDRAAGFAAFVPLEAKAPFLPDATIELQVAAVADDRRGTGIGSALASAGLRHARDVGFEYCIADWRSANLASSRTWTRWSFRPWAYRLHRAIDRRLAPASAAR
jgi:GNAT superfamily N-acetyltransferase